MRKNDSFDAELKITNWSKIIKVNERGDTITLNIGDMSLDQKIIALISDIQEIYNDIVLAEDKFAEDKFAEKLDFINSKTKEISDKVDLLFGKDTCIKVFNTNTPFIDDVYDFIFQISELIEKFTGEKIKNLDNIKNKFISKQKKRGKI